VNLPITGLHGQYMEMRLRIESMTLPAFDWYAALIAGSVAGEITRTAFGDNGGWLDGVDGMGTGGQGPGLKCRFASQVALR
jgi:hypothetical protein